jgi:hypothetical protein
MKTLKTYKSCYKPSVVMSIHGYLSKGKWQSELTSVITEQGLISKEFKYGFTVRFDKLKIEGLVDKFKTWYFDTINDPSNGLNLNKPFHRPSIVAHSLGTLIIAKALKKYPEIKFDKIFLHGSISPRDFDWYSLILKDKVNKVVVEKSSRDLIVRLGFIMTGSIFPCCRYGFIQHSTFLKYEEAPDFKHSDFQYKQRFSSQFEKHLYEAPMQLKVVNAAELSMLQLCKYFKASGTIDLEVYSTDYWDNSPITEIIAKEWALVEKGIWSFLVDSYNNKVLGYINTIAVDDKTYKSFIKGKLKEADITSGSIKSFSSGGNMNIIIMSVAINNEVKTRFGGLLSSKPGELLIMALSEKLTSISNKDQRVNNIASVAWTSQGEHLCKAFGMEDSKVRYYNHPIYTTTRKMLKRKSAKEVHYLCRWWIKRI